MDEKKARFPRRRWAIVALLVLVAAFGAPMGGAFAVGSPAQIALFYDNTYVDTFDDFSGEARNLRLVLEGLGHSVTTFEGTSAAAWSAALSGKDTLVIPERENFQLHPDLDEAARNVIRNFVAGGGKLVIHNFDTAGFLNAVFGFSLVEEAAADTQASLQAAAAGTEFAGGPVSLARLSSTRQLQVTSLPSGSKSVYQSGNQSWVTLMFHGQGSIAFLGWDWHNSNPPNDSDRNGGWLEVLDRAVSLSSGPDPASWQSNRVDVFVRGTDDAVWHRWWDGTQWLGYDSLGGVVTSDPTSVSWGPNRIDVFARGTDNALWHRWYENGIWYGWETLGGVLASAPDVSSWGPNRLDVLARGTDGALWHRWWDGNAWHGWDSLGGVLTSGPSAVSWDTNRVDVFARGTDNALWHRWWDGTAWHGWDSLGGVLTADPDAASWGPNRLDIFVRGTDKQLWHRWYDGANGWFGYEPRGGVLTGPPGAVSPAFNRINVFVRGTDRALWHTMWNGTSWTGYESLGGVLK